MQKRSYLARNERKLNEVCQSIGHNAKRLQNARKKGF